MVFMLAFLPQFVDAQQGTGSRSAFSVGAVCKSSPVSSSWVRRHWLPANSVTGYRDGPAGWFGRNVLGLGVRLLLTGDPRSLR
jgi:threonine/homoserine/homoserine lactone efflux protein